MTAAASRASPATAPPLRVGHRRRRRSKRTSPRAARQLQRLTLPSLKSETVSRNQPVAERLVSFNEGVDRMTPMALWLWILLAPLVLFVALSAKK